MSAAEKLERLHTELADDWQEPTEAIWDALPEIIAVVKAAEQIGRSDLDISSRLPDALAALDTKLELRSDR